MTRAALAPLACVVHCLATPILLSAAPVAFAHPTVEPALATFAAVVAVRSVGRGVRVHGRWHVLVPLVAGLALWLVALLELLALPEMLMVASGGILVVSAIVLNDRARPATCGCATCERRD